VKFWQSLSFTEPDQLVRVARICEEVGFEGVLVSDHLFHPEKLESKYPYSPDGRPGFTPETPWPEPWSAIGAMAAVTERLRFATMVYILPLRHPLEVAKATASVAALAGGRLALGVGAGWMREEFDALGVDFASRGARMDESIGVLRALWRGGMVEHHGRVFDFDRLQISPPPPAPIPVWIGGASPPALRRAARLGEGWMGSGNGVEEALKLLGSLRELRGRVGRERLPFEAIVPLTETADADALRRLEDAGMTGAVSYPFLYALGPTSSLDDKRRLLERYASEVIAKAR
jgi:probable F420-dependent oxidoreductase